MKKRIFVSLRSKQDHLGGNSPKENGLAQLQTVERFSKCIEKRCLIGTTILYLFWVLLKSIFKGERSPWAEGGGAFKMCISHGQYFIFVPDSQCLSLLHFLSRASPKCPTWAQFVCDCHTFVQVWGQCMSIWTTAYFIVSINSYPPISTLLPSNFFLYVASITFLRLL